VAADVEAGLANRLGRRRIALERLLDHMMKQPGVWITRRIDIARHWSKTHPYPGRGLNE
jgi:allantoinase